MDEYTYRVKEIHVRHDHESKQVSLGFGTEEGYTIIMEIDQGQAWHMKHLMEKAAGVEPISAEDLHAQRWWGMKP